MHGRGRGGKRFPVARKGGRIQSDTESVGSSRSVENIDDGEQSDSSVSSNPRGVLVPANDLAGPSAGVPPTDFRAQTELRRKYSELIEDCQTLRDKDGIEAATREKMKANIVHGRELFDKIGGGPGDMYMAFLHSKMCSDMILSKSERIGSSSSGFTIDSFLNVLKDKYTNKDTQDYEWKHFINDVSVEASKSQKCLPSMVALLGSFDRESILTPPEVKEKKPRATPRKKLADVDEPTRHEEVNLTAEQRAKQDKDNPETKSQELLKTLKERTKAKPSDPVALYEFTIGATVSQTAENLLHASFLARDGFVSITRKKKSESSHQKTLDSDLLVKPEKPPPKQMEKNKEDSTATDTSTTRSQHIVSFNARTYRAMLEACGQSPDGQTAGPSGQRTNRFK